MTELAKPACKYFEAFIRIERVLLLDSVHALEQIRNIVGEMLDEDFLKDDILVSTKRKKRGCAECARTKN